MCVRAPTRSTMCLLIHVQGVGKGKAADLAYWERAARGIAPALLRDVNKLRVVVEKSTVPVHTADAVAAVLEAEGVSNVATKLSMGHKTELLHRSRCFQTQSF